MTRFDSISRAGLGLMLFAGLMSGCATTEPRTHMAVVPAQVCSGDADSDGDGVSDCRDQCPGTLRGEAVDQNGCPLPVMEPKPYHG